MAALWCGCAEPTKRSIIGCVGKCATTLKIADSNVSKLSLDEDFTDQEYSDFNNQLDFIEKESLDTINEISEKARLEIEQQENGELKKIQAKKSRETAFRG